MLWVPYYNQGNLQDDNGPEFFYWYQLLWIPIGSALLLVLNRLWRAER